MGKRKQNPWSFRVYEPLRYPDQSGVYLNLNLTCFLASRIHINDSVSPATVKKELAKQIRRQKQALVEQAIEYITKIKTEKVSY